MWIIDKITTKCYLIMHHYSHNYKYQPGVYVTPSKNSRTVKQKGVVLYTGPDTVGKNYYVMWGDRKEFTWHSEYELQPAVDSIPKFR